MAEAVRTEVRHLYKREPKRKSRQMGEFHLVNTTRKLNEDEFLRVILYAQDLAMARIRARLKRRATREAAHD